MRDTVVMILLLMLLFVLFCLVWACGAAAIYAVIT
jgi:hypothetical protein